MKKVVRSITVRKKALEYRIIGYASSDRGTRIVAAVDDVTLEGKTKKEVQAEVAAVIATILKPQLNTG